MLLAVDVGNTNTVFALFDGEQPKADWRIATDTRRTADQYFVWFDHLMMIGGYGRAMVTDVAISTVVPETLFNLKVMARRYFGSEPLVVGEPETNIGVEISYPNPREIGADRLGNAQAAISAFGANLIVIDFGTATTFDVIDENSAYLGGVIAPGINLSLTALEQAAAKLPRVAVERPNAVVGQSTTGAMQSGVYWGYIGLIEGLCKRISAEQGREMTVIATGGLSPLFAAGTSVINHVDDRLTMRGLVQIHALNRSAAQESK